MRIVLKAKQHETCSPISLTSSSFCFASPLLSARRTLRSSFLASMGALLGREQGVFADFLLDISVLKLDVYLSLSLFLLLLQPETFTIEKAA